MFGKARTALTILIVGVGFQGCTYTVLRDLDEEARQAEWASIDSLVEAPDLTISRTTYEFIFQSDLLGVPRARNEKPVLKLVATIANTGNANFFESYYLISQEDPWPAPGGGRQVLVCNQRGDTMRVNDSQEATFYWEYPLDGAEYTTQILTNPKIQFELLHVHRFQDHVRLDPEAIPVTREGRYDNNYDTLRVPRLEDVLRRSAKPR